VATARGQRAEPVDETPDALEHATPDALEHATPDVELAEAQLAVGRPRGAAPDTPGDGEPDGDLDDDDETAAVDEEPVGTQLSSRGETSPTPRGGARIVHFLQGSWRELQRVQWPDRRQVMQATGVVIGFVIVAGLFLGAADWVAQRLVNLIIK
jgi:preprotein translocase SecE subunit